MNIANDRLLHFTGTQTYHAYLAGNVLTDGTLQLAEQFKCYLFIDIICSYTKQLFNHKFQVWTLEKLPDESAIVECTDGDNN